MTSSDIKSYWIRLNDDGTYSIDIDLNGYTITYSKAKVVFSCSQNIAFPVGIKIFDDSGNEVAEYSLTLNN